MANDAESNGRSTKTKPINRRTALKLAGAGATAALAGCADLGGGGGTPGGGELAGQEVHFVFGFSNARARELMDQVGNQLEEETGAILNVEYVGFGMGRNERLAQLFQAGNPPELANIEFSQAYSWQEQGLLAPVTDTIEGIYDEYGQPPESVQLVIDGDHYGIPWEMSFSDFWYRSDLLAETSLDNDFVPDTWDKVRTYVQEVDANTDIPGMYVPASESDPTSVQTISFLRTNNGQITEYQNGEWRAAFAQGQHRTRMVEVLEFLNEMHEYSPDAGGATWDTLSNSIAFEEGACCFFPGTRPKNRVTRFDRSQGWACETIDVGHMPEKRSTLGRLNAGSIAVFDTPNTEAAKRALEIFFQPDIAPEFNWADAPIHSQPPLPGHKESESWQENLDTLPECWDDASLDRHLNEATNHGILNVNEADRPSPYVGEIIASGHMAELGSRVYLNNEDPEDAIDVVAQNVNDQLEDLQS